jgi:predicted amidohydrolase
MTPDTANGGEIGVAAIQTVPVMNDVAGNLARQATLVAAAAADGADLIVLPECSTTGWVFESRDEARAVAEDLDQADGPALTAWTAWARDLGVHLVAGLVERVGDDLYNASVLVGPDGVIGRYRKTHIWGLEHDIYLPGDLGFPVYDTPLGRIGLLICYDIWFPECIRLEALQGADVVAVSANWVPVPTQHPGVPVIANQLCMTAAHTNLAYVVAASRGGIERGQPFIGSSIVVDHSGAPLAGPADTDGEAIVAARIAPIASRALRRGNPFNQPLRDRRLDLYAEMLGSGHDPGDY